MAYTKTNWVDRVVDGSGAVIVEGTPVNATNMNKIESAIEDLQGKAYKISLPVSSWTGSGPYTYVYPATGMTSDTTIDYTIDSTIDNLNGDLTITTGVGTITFSTPSLPSGTVTVTVMAVGVDADIQLIDWSSYCYSKDQAVAKTDIINNLTNNDATKVASQAEANALYNAISNNDATTLESSGLACIYLVRGGFCWIFITGQPTTASNITFTVPKALYGANLKAVQWGGTNVMNAFIDTNSTTLTVRDHIANANVRMNLIYPV